MTDEPGGFVREDRYIVVKRAHISPYSQDCIEKAIFSAVSKEVEWNGKRHLLNNDGQVACVVVEKDWPEYEVVWQMIEDRVAGRQQAERDTIAGGGVDDPARILKSALFALERQKVGTKTYGGVLTDGGMFAWLTYQLLPQGERPDAALATPAGVEGMREALAAAYQQGATDVHNHWLANPGEAPRGDPEFGEAASDYASAGLSTSPDTTGDGLREVLELAVLWARDDKCSYPAEAEKFEQRVTLLRAALSRQSTPLKDDEGANTDRDGATR